jgi:hypothetical protein
MDQLRKAVAGLAADSASSSADAPSSWHGAPLPRGFVDITSHVEARGCEILNAAKGGSVRTLIATGAPAALSGEAAAASAPDHVESSADDQLLLFMPFDCNVKVHSIQVGGSPPSPLPQKDLS